MIWILTAMMGAIAGPPPPGDVEAANLLAGCNTAAYDSPLSPDVPAWAAVLRSNRLDEFRSFAARFPKSRCTPAARQWIALRERAQAKFAAAPSAGTQPATLLGDPSLGIRSEDYPEGALANGEEGKVAVAYDIAPDGMVESCRVTQSSGSASLDEATCAIAIRRGRYEPARDTAGNPIRSRGTRRIVWQIPADREARVRRSLIPGWNVSVAPLKRY